MFNYTDTVGLMLSDDYKERFIAEYLQTKIRYEKLKAFNTKIEAGDMMGYEDQIEHDCPEQLLRDQQACMGEYLHHLELRAAIENIDLSECGICNAINEHRDSTPCCKYCGETADDVEEDEEDTIKISFDNHTDDPNPPSGTILGAIGGVHTEPINITIKAIDANKLFGIDAKDISEKLKNAESKEENLDEIIEKLKKYINEEINEFFKSKENTPLDKSTKKKETKKKSE